MDRENTPQSELESAEQSMQKNVFVSYPTSFILGQGSPEEDPVREGSSDEDEYPEI